jgi:hypothetical protein
MRYRKEGEVEEREEERERKREVDSLSILYHLDKKICILT